MPVDVMSCLDLGTGLRARRPQWLQKTNTLPLAGNSGEPRQGGSGGLCESRHPLFAVWHLVSIIPFLYLTLLI